LREADSDLDRPEVIIEEAWAEELTRSLRGKEKEMMQNAKNVLE
jgi:hypothetical protein